MPLVHPIASWSTRRQPTAPVPELAHLRTCPCIAACTRSARVSVAALCDYPSSLAGEGQVAITTVRPVYLVMLVDSHRGAQAMGMVGMSFTRRALALLDACLADTPERNANLLIILAVSSYRSLVGLQLQPNAIKPHKSGCCQSCGHIFTTDGPCPSPCNGQRSQGIPRLGLALHNVATRLQASTLGLDASISSLTLRHFTLSLQADCSGMRCRRRRICFRCRSRRPRTGQPGLQEYEEHRHKEDGQTRRRC